MGGVIGSASLLRAWRKQPPTRWVIFTAIALLATSTVTATIEEPPRSYRVENFDARDAERLGAEIVDEYSAFFTARLTPLVVSFLESSGGTAVALNYTIERGQLSLGSEAAIVIDENTGHYILQFRGPVKSEWLGGLASRGVVFYDSLPHHAYIVYASPLALQAAVEFPPVRRVVPYEAAFKLSPHLAASGETKLSVYLHPDADSQIVVARIVNLGGRPGSVVTSGPDRIIPSWIDAGEATTIASWDEVSWIEPAYSRGSVDGDKASSVLQGGATGPYEYPIHDEGINGSTQIGLTCDNGLPTTRNTSYSPQIVIKPSHEATLDGSGTELEYNAHLASSPLNLGIHAKIPLYYSPQEPNGTNLGNWGATENPVTHGLRVLSVMAGNKDQDDERDPYDGVAFRARIAVCDIMDDNGTYHILDDLWRYYSPGFGVGANVSSNSGGGEPYTNVYNGRSRQLDFIVWNHTNFTLVNSIGNVADIPPENVCVRTMRPEAVAKSVIVVGGTENKKSNSSAEEAFTGDNIENISLGGCMGPTSDGRIKPNLVAPSFCVTSARGLTTPTSYSCMAGTSFASPPIGGSALLIRDYFKKGFYPTGVANPSNERANVSSALVRAMLESSAKEITGDLSDPTYPNSVQGWGRPVLENVLHFSGDADKLLVTDEWDATNLTTGNVWTKGFTVHSNRPVRVFLAWSDYPGTPTGGNTTMLVNNLNLRVQGPPLLPGDVNTTYLGNKFVPTISNPNVPTESLEGQGTADAVNVEEGVIICNNIVDPITFQGSCNVKTGSYVVRVVAAETRSEGQRFALVIVGDVSWT